VGRPVGVRAARRLVRNCAGRGIPARTHTNRGPFKRGAQTAIFVGAYEF